MRTAGPCPPTGTSLRRVAPLRRLLSRTADRAALWDGHDLSAKARYLHACSAPLLGEVRAHLDLGCGDGEVLAAFRPSAGSHLGLDIDEARLARCRAAGLQARAADLTAQLPLETGSFDLVTLISVLEHVEQPHPLVAEILRVLRPGGKIVVQIPNPRFLVDLHYFLPLYGWLPTPLRPFYRALFRGQSSGISYYTNSIGRREVMRLFRTFETCLDESFFYPVEVAPHWARPFHAAFVGSGLHRLCPTGYLFVFRKPDVDAPVPT